MSRRPRDGQRRRVRRRLPGRPERGAATLELVVLFPVVLLITFGVIEGALWYHARNVALAAAEEGVRVATGNGGSLAAGVAEARSFAQEAGADGVLSSVTVSGDGGDVEVTITVEGSSQSLFPGWSGHQVSQTASGPVERFTGPG
ncbi:TadE/TadG family type IV pilus assembly protein [Jiangella rhizosphaerae]|uniref:Pilus assembly protein n=1 Tax=Jiangella rhizosphaerae TaxID=2293569 RepID=A0A418KVG8_9ACTN|nr:TadE/TadG family type IV pilus assembly protein [Jiangella rhizosphaerae]RIQ33603.1 pilus assembly protein [Jiangella rhizosphaerae]